MQTDSRREIRTEVDSKDSERDPNRGRRRAADKYRFSSSREVRTEIDEEHIRQVHSTESHKYGDEREQTTDSS
ncbi:hypothetical protein Tco_1100374 [Tanacetum coccineum]